MQTIEIETSQNVAIEYELAGLRERGLAFFIDLLIVIVGFLLLFFTLTTVFGRALNNAEWVFGLLISLGPVLFFMGYHFLMEFLADGQSLGKKAMGLKVVRLDGREPGGQEYFLRALFHLLDSIFSSGILAAILISSQARGQRLGDLTANTTVIRLNNRLQFTLDDILQIATTESYQPQYPQVRQLREEDMLLIKTSINRYQTFGNPAHAKALGQLVDRVCSLLEIEKPKSNYVGFLKTLLKDYIVLTR